MTPIGKTPLHLNIPQPLYLGYKVVQPARQILESKVPFSPCFLVICELYVPLFYLLHREFFVGRNTSILILFF